ncbi:multicopper oxidase [Viridothelium virens]|uniref:Multicopper oxidase n=1 Tax=Viridothelium virens TaxID=1048519 RepID=A0A6A6H5B0_VIRVR|nr:multicopper oxidase [Viridothelium virens]
MGFLNACWDAFLFVSSFNPLHGYNRDQQPLSLTHGSTEEPLVAVTSFRPPNSSITCQYPTGWTSCGSANNRTCWLKNTGKVSGPSEYDIYTEYENAWPTGVLREYWLSVTETPLFPDGYLKPTGLVFNNTYPGPVLEACWGDTIRVHVTNFISTEGSTIHWHGIRQLGTNQMDGVNGVTQCPIAQNDTFTYQFLAQQYGHTWYHSHYQTQYSDGVMGGLVIHGPSSANYDEAFSPALINDWVHANSTDVLNQELVGGGPLANSIVFNGTGNFRCSDLDPFCCNTAIAKVRDNRCPVNTTGSPVPAGGPFVKTFQYGKRYLLRLVNSSAGSMFIFSIDGHELEVIATDLVPIKPYTTGSLFIGIGQRYQVVVTAKQNTTSTQGQYWIRTRVATGCGSVEEDDEETGIIRYTNTTFPPTTVANDGKTDCVDEPVDSLVPVVQWNVTSLDNAKTEAELNQYSFVADISNATFEHFNRWELTFTPLFLNYSNPSLLNISGTLNDPNYAAINYDFQGNFVVLVVDGINLGNIPKKNVPIAHPIHMHGHDFVILDQSNASFDASKALQSFNFKNPPRRDVALLPAGGYLALGFQPDNPGIWLVHCHIAWHASSGLALQIFERTEAIPSALGKGALNVTEKVCANWDKWDLKFNQTDSGI